MKLSSYLKDQEALAGAIVNGTGNRLVVTDLELADTARLVEKRKLPLTAYLNTTVNKWAITLAEAAFFGLVTGAALSIAEIPWVIPTIIAAGIALISHILFGRFIITRSKLRIAALTTPRWNQYTLEEQRIIAGSFRINQILQKIELQGFSEWGSPGALFFLDISGVINLLAALREQGEEDYSNELLLGIEHELTNVEATALTILEKQKDTKDLTGNWNSEQFVRFFNDLRDIRLDGELALDQEKADKTG